MTFVSSVVRVPSLTLLDYDDLSQEILTFASSVRLPSLTKVGYVCMILPLLVILALEKEVRVFL